LFDGSGNFHQRHGSFKGLRTDGGTSAASDGYYDLSREASVAAIPTVPKLDVGRIRDLLVKANEMAGTVRSRLSVDGVSEETKELARFNMALLDLVSAVVEEGILPLSSPAAAAASFASVAGTAPPAQSAPSRPRVEPGMAELKAGLASDKTAVVFDADLGPSPVTNQATLNGAFAAGLKATLKVAADAGGDANEAIRVVNDALSCADNVDFKGQTSSKLIDKRDPNNPVVMPFCSMPVKLDFPDRNTRIHFERTIRKHCNLKATISLPTIIQKYQALYLNAVKECHPGRVVMVRPDVASLSLVALFKEEGGGAWTRCPGGHPILCGILLPDYKLPNRVDLPAAGVAELGDSDDAMLHPLARSLNPELKCQPSMSSLRVVTCVLLFQLYKITHVLLFKLYTIPHVILTYS
jgi:hypothetical protein